MKDREPRLSMTENPVERERLLGETDEAKFVQSGIESYAASIARFSLVPTPHPDWRKAEGDDQEIASLLSEITIDDRALAERVGAINKDSSPEQVAEATSVAVGKLRVAREDAPTETKSFLDKFKDKLLEKTGKFIAARGGKKALAAALIPVLAVACSGDANAGTQGVPVETQQSVATAVFTPTPEITPTPAVEPTPTVVPGQFEYDFQPDQPGYIPAELSGGGGTGEIAFNSAQSAGGEISTEIIKEEGFVPLVVEPGILSAELGRAVFLPHPQEMVYVNSNGEIEELTFSLEQSGQGFAAYVDANGQVRRRMLTILPNSETGNYVATISFNEENRGVVYAIRVGTEGQILEQIPIVFDENTELQTEIINGGVRTFIDGQRVVVEHGEFAEISDGIIGGFPISSINEIPPELLAPIEQETLDTLRFRDDAGNPLRYGRIVGREFSWAEDQPERVYDYHLRFLGRLEAPSEMWWGPDVKYYLAEIPVERLDPETGNLIETGVSQYIVLMIQTSSRSMINVGVVYLNNGVLSSSDVQRDYDTLIPPAAIERFFDGLPRGASLIFGNQFFWDQWPDSKMQAEREEVAALDEGLTYTLSPSNPPNTFYFGNWGAWELFVDSSFR